jgi:lipopolysaccharide/colanic/teichoic acid biosynthesis glycosyltransferase
VSRLQETRATRGVVEPSSISERRRKALQPISAARPRPLLAQLPHERQTEPQRDPRKPARAGNVFLAGLALAVAAPLMVLIALVVKLSSPGPVIYAQRRIGLDHRAGTRRTLGDRRRLDLGGRPFTIYKFRTMYAGSGRPSRQIWTRPNDRRITPVGKVLRAYRLDEIPQLVNVVKGDMNIVGPRPEQPEIFARLREQLDRYPERQRIRPGITGLAQVRCGYGGTLTEVERKLQHDLEYLSRRSFWLDMAVLLRTIPVVLTRRGAR